MCAKSSSMVLSSLNSRLRWSITSCGTSGLLGGLLVEGVPFNILIIASPDVAFVLVAGFAEVRGFFTLVVAFLVVVFFGSYHDSLSFSFRSCLDPFIRTDKRYLSRNLL